MPSTEDSPRHTFQKAERLCGRKRIDRLFSSGNRSLAAYPLRAVYILEEREGAPVEVLISVPKRLLKRAVDRNRVKRLVREAYRLNKGLLLPSLGDRRIALAFLWISNQMADFQRVETKVKNLLQRIAEDLC
ncbi:MAG: ribonuclease P protein component [Prevotellaceae bacterium]|nr:ribonuclease P protein component [Prevotellaceae bacterium]MCD8304345.1 ribonuclease P protein component [Prevotellaceae bacterium]